MSISSNIDSIETHLKKYSESERTSFYIDQSFLGLINPSSTEWKTQYYRNNVHYNFLHDFLTRHDLINDVIVLKGVAILDLNIYENLGQRLTGDIDLLVSDFTNVERALISENFVLVETKNWKGNDFKKVYQKVIAGIEVAVELHARLFYHIDYADYNFSKTPSGFKVLSHEWMLMHLVGHLAFQHTFLKIHWLLEINQYVENYRNEIDWNYFNYLINKFEFNNSWKLTQYFLNLTFKQKLTSNIILRYFCDIDFILFPEKNKVSYYLIKFMTKDSPLTFISYAVSWLISSGWKK